VAHVQYRAERLGYRLPLVADPQHYRFPCGLWKFRAMLEWEQERLLDAPLSVVAATPPPETYQAFSAALLAASTPQV
jgi:hypothetical protein